MPTDIRLIEIDKFKNAPRRSVNDKFYIGCFVKVVYSDRSSSSGRLYDDMHAPLRSDFANIYYNFANINNPHKGDLIECFFTENNGFKTYSYMRNITKNDMLEFIDCSLNIDFNLDREFGRIPSKEIYRGLMREGFSFFSDENNKKIIKLWRCQSGVNGYNHLDELGFDQDEIESLIEYFGAGADEIIKKDPYKALLVRGIDFDKIDLLGMKLNNSFLFDRRLEVCVFNSIKYLMRKQGDTVVDPTQLLNIFKAYFEGRKGNPTAKTYLSNDVLKVIKKQLFNYSSMLNDSINKMISKNYIINVSNGVSLTSYFLVEFEILKIINEYIKYSIDGSVVSDSINYKLKGVYEGLKKEMEANNLYFNKIQEEVVLSFMNNKLTILTGGPGTGKTFVSSFILNLAKKANLSIKACAPTGKAARRVMEMSGLPAETIHKMLGFDGVAWSEKLPYDLDLIIIDEFSMVDSLLCARLILNIPERTKIVIVGDADQLPSISPGNILFDIIHYIAEVQKFLDKKANIVHTLRDIMRQKENSGIVKLSNSLIKNSSVFLEMYKNNISKTNDSNDIFDDTVFSLVLKSDSFYSVLNRFIFHNLINYEKLPVDYCDRSFSSKNYKELQKSNFFKGFSEGKWDIITPLRKKEFFVSTDSLNLILRKKLNRENYVLLDEWFKSKKGEKGFRYQSVDNIITKGDKVICTKNKYRPKIKMKGVKVNSENLGFPIYNGEIGVVDEVYISSDNLKCPGKNLIFDEVSILPEPYNSNIFFDLSCPIFKIKFEGRGDYTYLNMTDMKDIHLGYAITIHKSQGSEFDNVLIILPDIMNNFLTKNILYTAMTRAKKKLLILCKNATLIDIAIKESANKSRNTIFSYISNLIMLCAEDASFKEEFAKYKNIFNNFISKNNKKNRIEDLDIITQNFNSVYSENIKDIKKLNIEDEFNDDEDMF